MSESSPSFDDLSVAAILARRSREDRDGLLDDLVAMLGEAVPGVQVKRSLIGRRVVSVTMPFGEYAYALTRGSGGAFEASRRKIVRGVAIKTEPMEIHEFLEELGAAIDVELRRTEKGRDALTKWLASS